MTSPSRPGAQPKDMRTWIAQLEAAGELIRIDKPVDPLTQMGSLLYQSRDKALLFEKLPHGWRSLGQAPANVRHAAIAFGTPEEALIPHVAHKLGTRIPPVMVANGPVKDVKLGKGEFDLTQLPVHVAGLRDGGPVIGSGLVVTKDPDTGKRNVSFHRLQIKGPNKSGILLYPRHSWKNYLKYQARNEPMPVAIVVGGDPLLFLMACTEMPYGVCEFDITGGLRGKPVKVVRGPVTGLPIPANAEMVIEGFVQPGKRKLEGPFGEWTGYYGSDIREEPVLDIKAIYHRNSPIIMGCPPQRPPEETARYRAIMRSALLRRYVQSAGVPDVSAVWAHEVGGTRLLLGVSIKQRYAGHSKQAGHVASQCHAVAYAGKYVIVVDDDIDVSNLEELVWAMLTRSDPATSIDIITGTWSTPLDPRITPEDKAKGNNTNSRAIIDACRPFHWRDKFPKVNMPSPEVRKKAREKWGHLVD